VTYADLDKIELFPNHASLHQFLKFYSRFDFNEPEPISQYGPKPRTLEDAVASQVLIFNDRLRNQHDLHVSRSCGGRSPAFWGNHRACLRALCTLRM
jgi:hypothetical protein